MSTRFTAFYDKDGAEIAVEGAQIREEVRPLIRMPTSGKWGMLNLNAENAQQLYCGLRMAFEHAFGREP